MSVNTDGDTFILPAVHIQSRAHSLCVKHIIPLSKSKTVMSGDPASRLTKKNSMS